jgi:hypothetical protein
LALLVQPNSAWPGGSTWIGANGLSRCDARGKPFSYPELRGRVAALLRRVDGRRTLGRLRVGDLEVDPPSREVRLRGSRVELSQKEFALLRTLAGEPTRVLTKASYGSRVAGGLSGETGRGRPPAAGPGAPSDDPA